MRGVCSEPIHQVPINSKHPEGVPYRSETGRSAGDLTGLVAFCGSAT